MYSSFCVWVSLVLVLLLEYLQWFQELMYLLEDSSNEPGYLQELDEEEMQDGE